MLTSYAPFALLTAGGKLSDNKGLLMAVVTSSGIIIVFVILLLLIFIFYAYGGIFRSLTASKLKKAEMKKAENQNAGKTSVPAPQAASVPQPSPAVEGEIPGEIIAVIAAAVAAVSGDKTYSIKKVARSQRPSGRRSSWAAAGVYENTRPF
jgi:Negative regulator of septation ring formation